MHTTIASQNYTYTLKLIGKKKKPVVKQLHRVAKKFKCIEDLMNEVSKVINEDVTGDLGYYEGRQCIKQ